MTIQSDGAPIQARLKYLNDIALKCHDPHRMNANDFDHPLASSADQYFTKVNELTFLNDIYALLLQM